MITVKESTDSGCGLLSLKFPVSQVEDCKVIPDGPSPQGYGDKHITLYDIRAELSCRYKDLRTAYRSPNTEEIFNMLTKETPETFYIGKL